MSNLGLAAMHLVFRKTENDTLGPADLLILFKAIEAGEIPGDKFHKCLMNTLDAKDKRIEELVEHNQTLMGENIKYCAENARLRKVVGHLNRYLKYSKEGDSLGAASARADMNEALREAEDAESRLTS